MSIVKETVASVRELEKLAKKLECFDEFEDLNELIEIMNYGSKIKHVLNWINATATPVAVLAEPAKYIEEKLALDVDPVEPIIVPEPIVEDVKQETVKILNNEISPDMKALAESVADAMFAAETSKEELVEKSEIEERTEYSAKEFPLMSNSYNYPTQVMKRIMENYEKQEWIHYKRINWIRSTKSPVMISEEGDFWSLADDRIIRLVWADGDMRVNVSPDEYPEDLKRAANMIANAFNIKRPSDFNASTTEYVLDFKNHDRRDLRVDNLTFIKSKDQLSVRNRLIHDICQRCLDDKFDTAKVIAHYIDIRPQRVAREITREYIYKIINKTDCAEISDAYWAIDMKTGDPVPLEQKKNGSINIAEVFSNTSDIDLAESLFNTKINGNYNLSSQEKELLVNIAKIKLPANKRTFSNIAQQVHNVYGWAITADEVKGLINNPTNITKIFNNCEFVKGVNAV